MTRRLSRITSSHLRLKLRTGTRPMRGIYRERQGKRRPNFIQSRIRLVALFCSFSLFYVADLSMPDVSRTLFVYRSLADEIQPTEPLLLDPGAPVEGELGPGQTKRYRVSANAGQYLRVIVEACGIDLSVSLITPDSKELAEFDGPYGDRETESVSMIAQVYGEYEIELRETKHSRTAGRLRISLDGPHAPAQTDQARIDGEKAFMEGQRLREGRDDESLNRAIAKYNEALRYWHAAGDRYEEAKALICIAKTIWNLSSREREAEVIEFDTQAINLCREIADRRGEAFVLGHLGYIYLFSDQPKAREHSTRALALWREQDDKFNEASALNNIGGSYENEGDVQAALQYYNESLGLRRELNDVSGIANMLNNIGLIHDRLGESQEALRHYEQVMNMLGDSKSLDLRARKALAGALNNRGYTYLELGNAEMALESCSQSLPLQREVRYAEGEISTLLNIGKAHVELGDPLKALSYYKQAQNVSRRNRAEREKAYALARQGQAYTLLGKSQTALVYYFRALGIFRKHGDREGEATVLDRIGGLFAAKGNRRSASRSYARALALWNRIKDPRGRASTLYGIARVERARGNLAEAHRKATAAIDAIEALRARVVSGELRTSYLASVHDYYDLDIDLLMKLHKRKPLAGYDSQALRLSEFARARSFLESLGEVGKEIREGVDPKLLEREQALQREIEAKIQLQVQFLKDKKTEERGVLIEKEIKTLIAERKQTEDEIRATSLHYARLTQPQPVGLEECQQLLDPDSLLLKYAPGEKRSYLWLVSRSEIKSYELPRRAIIEASAKQVCNLVSSREAIFSTGQSRYWTKAAALSRMIFGPVARELGNKRLLIVTEGALQYVPFHSLPIPQTRRGTIETGSAGLIPMIAEHEIVGLPSISVAAALRAELANRKVAGKEIAVFADPVFEEDDERFQSTNKDRPAAANKPVERGFRSPLREFARYNVKLERLKYSRAEADAIQSMSIEPTINLAFDASRVNAKNPEIGDYKILHFATHGLLNSNQPDLSCIALSQFDAGGERQDGFLLLNDIYNLKLSADLVVLSACSTALGKDIKGEGLVGLTRGFMYAGAARVMASLWNVDDERTAELMKLFYEKFLNEKLQPAAALRAAQLEMWRSKNNNSPYYWGAFVLQGEWKDRAAEGLR